MLSCCRRVASVLLASFLACAGSLPASAADPEIDRLVKGPVGKDWVTNGGNLTNQRYSTLKQINTENVKQLKGAWMTRLKGSGMGSKYSAEATPLVKDGIMYVVTGNDDVFALNAKTGEIQWERWSGIDQQITTVCCGWLNRGLAMGEGMVFLGQLDANVVALDIKTGKEVWKTPIEDWKNGYGVTSAPLYYDGIIYSGITGGEYGVRGRLTALEAKTGKILWRSYTLPAPGEVGAETWPAGTTHAMRGGATIWNTPALDPELGLLYFATGNCGPDYDGAMREGDNLFCASIMAIDVKTGQYKWHFQQVHHDIWDYDAASPVVLFDTVINGQPRKALAEAGRTGWVYILDRTNGKPLIGIEEKPVPQEPRQKTAKTQPIPVGDATVPQCQQPLPGYPQVGCIYDVFWDTPVVIQPGGQGGTNWSPMPYSPDTGLLYVPGTIRASAFVRYGDNTWKNGCSMSAARRRHRSARRSVAPSPRSLPPRTKSPGSSRCRIVWAAAAARRSPPAACCCAANRTATSSPSTPRAARCCSSSRPASAPMRRRSSMRWTGSSTSPSSPAATGSRAARHGDAVWTFALNGNVQPLHPPPPPAQVAGPLGPIAEGVNTVRIGANNIEFGYAPARTRVKPGTKVTFTNVGDLPHTATATAGMEGKWDTDVLAKGESKVITFDQPGIYYYICMPHPYMYGQVIVEP